MKIRLLTLMTAALLTASVAACADNAEDHAREADESRTEASQEAASGDPGAAAEEMQNAAQHDSAAVVDSAQGDNTEGVN